jgi:hypothetical protein
MVGIEIRGIPQISCTSSERLQMVWALTLRRGENRDLPGWRFGNADNG